MISTSSSKNCVCKMLTQQQQYYNLSVNMHVTVNFSLLSNKNKNINILCISQLKKKTEMLY